MRRVRRGAAAAAFLALVASAPAGFAGEHRGAFRGLPPGREILYLPEKYAACVPCHPRAVFEDEDFNVDTDFRDTGLGKNLHWMHVFRQPQGTNCTACHRLDEATGRLSYAPEAGITTNGKGGTCAPGCHRPKEYRNAGRTKR